VVSLFLNPYQIPKTSMRVKTVLITLLSAISLFAGCSRKIAHKDSEPEGPAASVQTKSYPARGKVTALDPKMPAIEIDHEDINGLMPAMQMEFHVKDRALLDGLSVGDRIEFTIENGVGGMRVVAIRKI
jgi:Cu(I)/Ag(I) efflux system protein CusF